MTCCAEPLIALFGGVSVISAFMGIINRDPVMIIGGVTALIVAVAGYRYYRSGFKRG